MYLYSEQNKRMYLAKKEICIFIYCELQDCVFFYTDIKITEKHAAF